MSSTIYMRESVSESYWINVYYGPEWPITPCKVKHYLRIMGLEHKRGLEPEISIDQLSSRYLCAPLSCHIQMMQL